MPNFEGDFRVENQLGKKIKAMQNEPSSPTSPRIGISHGDINGISYEIILKAFADVRLLTMLTPVLYGQSKVFSYYKKNFGLEDFNYSLTRDARQAWKQKFNIINIVENELKLNPGAPSELSTEMSVLSLKQAASDLKNGYIDALVMAPDCRAVAKNHLGFLSSTFDRSDILRLLVGDRMRIGLATDDAPLSEALQSINKEMVMKKLKTLSQALKTDFKISSPKIAVMGINPHADEPQAEDKSILLPAVAEAQKNGVMAFGPFSASRLFTTGLWQKYDAVLAMTYEQGVFPFKIMSVEGGAFYLVGLPGVCTAPMHGPAFDIANTDQASPDSFRRALYLAIDILTHRQE